MAHVHHPLTNPPVSNPLDLANTFCDYYQSLYNRKDDLSTHQPTLSSIQAFLDTILLPTLSSSQIQTLSSPYSPTEIETVIKTLPSNKAPGGNEYVNEYFKQFVSILSATCLTSSIMLRPLAQ